MGKVEKISLNEKQMELVTYYSENDMARLKRICNPIINMKNVDQKDYDDLYSDALKVLLESVQAFDETADCSFNTFLTGNIKRSFYDWSRDQLTWKRCNLEYETDENGEIKKDKNGKPIKKKVYDVSMDVPLEDGSDLREKIPSNFSVETEIKKHEILDNENVSNYMETLGLIQKEIAKMIILGYSNNEIKEELKLSDKNFSLYFSDMKKTEKKRILKRDEDFVEISEEENVMNEKNENRVTTSEKTKNTSYSLEAIKKKLEKHRLRDDHPLQRESGQWDGKMKSELISDILQGRSLLPIIISEEIKNAIILHWLIDGKQRCTTTEDYMNDGFAISKQVQIFNINYQTDKVDENGNVILTEDGFPIPENKTFDIRNKKFSQLPEELQDKIKEYQMPVMLNLNCKKKEIAYDISRFNRGRTMNKAQNGWTGLDETFAEYVDNILKLDMFKVDSKKSQFTKQNYTSGSMRRTVVEAIITTFFAEKYSSNFRDMCEYLTNESSESNFIDFYVFMERLNSVISEKASYLFNAKNAYLWMALFVKYTELNIPDEKFSDFLDEFVNVLHSREINGATYDEIDSEKHTKDKNYTIRKMNIMLDILYTYFNVDLENTYKAIKLDRKKSTKSNNKTEKTEVTFKAEEATESENNTVEEVEISTENKTEIEAEHELQFIREMADPNVEQEDIELYVSMLDDEEVSLDSEIYKAGEAVLVALMAFACEEETDKELGSWLRETQNNNRTFTGSEKDNYEKLKAEFLTFLDSHGNKAA